MRMTVSLFEFAFDGLGDDVAASDASTNAGCEWMRIACESETLFAFRRNISTQSIEESNSKVEVQTRICTERTGATLSQQMAVSLAMLNCSMNRCEPQTQSMLQSGNWSIGLGLGTRVRLNARARLHRQFSAFRRVLPCTDTDCCRRDEYLMYRCV